MRTDLRDHLLAFIKAAASKQTGENSYDGHPDGSGPNRRHQFRLSDGGVTLSFGYGYFNRENVLYDTRTEYNPDGYFEELTPEEAVDRFLKDADLDR